MEKRRIEIITFASHIDKRGELVSTDRKLPFDVRNVFWIYGNDYPRGGHAHKRTAQVLVCLHGSVDVSCGGADFILCSSHYGLYVPPNHKVDMRFDTGSILLVLCSERYDSDDYIQ